MNAAQKQALEIARSNANAAIDQRDAYEDSVASYARNVVDTLVEYQLFHYRNAALAAYYTRVGELMAKVTP